MIYMQMGTRKLAASSLTLPCRVLRPSSISAVELI